MWVHIIVQLFVIVLFFILGWAVRFKGQYMLISGFNNRSSMGIGAGMISRGEVALILAALGLEGGLLPTEYYTSMIIVIIVTTLVTPPLLKVTFGTRN